MLNTACPSTGDLVMNGTSWPAGPSTTKSTRIMSAGWFRFHDSSKDPCNLLKNKSFILIHLHSFFTVLYSICFHTEFMEWFCKDFKIVFVHLISHYSDIYKSAKIVKNFQEILENIFMPLFEVSRNPQSHPELHKFLMYVSEQSYTVFTAGIDYINWYSKLWKVLWYRFVDCLCGYLSLVRCNLRTFMNLF